MAINIAGREVKIGSTLYHKHYEAFGTVSQFDRTGSAELIIQTSTGEPRRVWFTNGGKVNGKKLIYWHKPLEIDLPNTDIQPLQDIINVVLTKMKEFNSDNYAE